MCSCWSLVLHYCELLLFVGVLLLCVFVVHMLRIIVACWCFFVVHSCCSLAPPYCLFFMFVGASLLCTLCVHQFLFVVHSY
jgi:hypothetical protein